jgi:hypothetical protein
VLVAIVVPSSIARIGRRKAKNTPRFAGVRRGTRTIDVTRPVDDMEP